MIDQLYALPTYNKYVGLVIVLETGRSSGHSLGLENICGFFERAAACRSDVFRSRPAIGSNRSQSRYKSLGYCGGERIEIVVSIESIESFESINNLLIVCP